MVKNNLHPACIFNKHNYLVELLVVELDMSGVELTFWLTLARFSLHSLTTRDT